MPENSAAWMPKAKGSTLEIKSAPYTKPQKNEVVVRNHAVAINPVDWIVMDVPRMVYPWLKPPFVLGTDLAGEVVEVGFDVTRFQVGDRVLGHAVGARKEYNTSAKGAFQLYTVMLEHMTAKIPDTMSYEDASVIPLGFSTASCSLFQPDQLALQYPSVDPTPTGKMVLIWGGATSVGSNAIQLAIAAGYEVITTCSPKNYDYVKRLGASRAFDYRSNTVVADIIKAFDGRPCAGALSIGQGAADACLDILPRCKGNKFLSMASFPIVPGQQSMVSTILKYASWAVSANLKAKIRGVQMKFVIGDTLIDNGIGKVVYEDFLAKALANGSFIAAPEAQVVGKGLEQVQAGLETQKKGVSAKKIVISL